MLAPERVAEVKRLLAEGSLSQRRIAKQTGVSRATVGAIASGKRPDYSIRRPEETDPLTPTGPPSRCKGCGGMVYLPCRVCYVRRLKARRKAVERAWRRHAFRQSALARSCSR